MARCSSSGWAPRGCFATGFERSSRTSGAPPERPAACPRTRTEPVHLHLHLHLHIKCTCLIYCNGFTVLIAHVLLSLCVGSAGAGGGCCEGEGEGVCCRGGRWRRRLQFAEEPGTRAGYSFDECAGERRRGLCERRRGDGSLPRAQQRLGALVQAARADCRQTRPQAQATR